MTFGNYYNILHPHLYTETLSKTKPCKYFEVKPSLFDSQTDGWFMLKYFLSQFSAVFKPIACTVFLSLLWAHKLRLYAKIKKANTFNCIQLPVSTMEKAEEGQFDCNILQKHFSTVFINISQCPLSDINIFDRNLL